MDALDRLAPLSDRYATLPVADAFDWATAGAGADVGEWYLVVFRSIHRADADPERLREYDDRAHEEAASAPGFIHYFKGPPATDRSCLSFCLWDSRAHARSAAGRPAHRAAVMILDEMYEHYTLEFLRVRRSRPWGPLEFEPYDPSPPTEAHRAA
jgi:hypothetical protein